MTGNRFIAILAAIVAIGAALAVTWLFIDGQRLIAPPPVEEGPVAGESGVTAPAGPQAELTETAPGEATAALTPPSGPTTVPTFDVVVIEPSGEGVIAGRAAPGWKVSVQSGGVKVAEAKADLQGEWSVVLEKPLPLGDHALSLKIVSPDGTRAVSSQETVRVAVGTGAKQPITAGQPAVPQLAPSPHVTATEPATVAPAPAPQAEALPSLAAIEPDVARALTRAEQEALSALPAGATARSKPAVVFKTVDYELSGEGSGTVTITGTSEPGAAIVLYYGKERLAEARADASGSWRVHVAKTLGMGQHSFRAERAGAPSGTTVAAVISIERAEPQPVPSPSTPEVAAKGSVPQVAVANGQPPGTVAKEVYTIRRGDTLWAIAKRYLGSGLRYTAIFQDNRGIISNPDLIHPQQEVSIPNP